jgi:hypothetical protein
MEEELKDDPRIKLQRAREKEYLEKKLEEQERKRARKVEEKPEEEKDLQMEGEGGVADGPAAETPAFHEAVSASSGPAVFVPEDTPMEEGVAKRHMTLEELAHKLKESKKARVA